jgi:hypothetical protein
LLAALLCVAVPAQGQTTTTIAVSNAAGAPGATGIAVQVTTTNPITVGSTDLVLTFDPVVLQATSVSSGTLSGFDSGIDNTMGEVHTASASGSGNSLPAGGVLFTVVFSVNPTAPVGPSPLGIVDADGMNDLGGVPPPIPPAPIPYTPMPGTFTVLAPATITPTPTLSVTTAPTDTPTGSRSVTATPTLSVTPSGTRTSTPTNTPGGTQPPAINVGSGAGAPGAMVTIPVTLASNGSAVGGISVDIDFDSTAFSIAPATDCVINPAIGPGTGPNKQLSAGKVCSNGSGVCTTTTDCTPPNTCGIVRVGIFGFNTNPIPDGQLFTCKFTIAAGAAPGVYPLSNGCAAADPIGATIGGTTCGAGSITVQGADTPTNTPTSSRSITPTPTLSVTITPTASQTITPTPTVTLPSPTPTHTSVSTPTPSLTKTATPSPTRTDTSTPTPTTTATAVTTIAVSDATGARGATGIAVQVTTTNAITVGSTDLVLTFNPAVLQATSASSSTLGGFDSNIDNTIGEVRTASATGSGDALGAGEVLFTVVFSVNLTAPLGPSPLGIVDADGMNDLGGVSPPIPPPAIAFTPRQGTFQVTGPTITPTDTLTPTPTKTATSTPTQRSTDTHTRTPTLTVTITPTQSRTNTPTFTPSNSPTAATPTPPRAPAINAGSGAGAPGVTVTIPVTLASNGSTVGGTSDDIDFDSQTVTITPATDCVINPAIGPGSGPNKQLSAGKVCSNGSGVCTTTADCTPPNTCSIVRVGIFGFNTNPIPDGELFTCKFTIAAGAAPGVYPLSNGCAAADPNGNTIPGTTCGTGSITVCVLDVDGNGVVDVATDIVYIARTLLGLPPVPASFRALNPAIPPDQVIKDRVQAIGLGLDVDANGVVDVATDIVYIARRLLGLPPVPASFRALNPSIPPDPVIAANIDALCP